MKSLSIVDESAQAGTGCSTPAGVSAMQRTAPHQGAFQGRAAIVTLGCAKNQVDSEVMLGVLEKSGFEIVSSIAEADVAVINTCGFLESAVQESINATLEAAEYKTKGRLRRLIVAGCAVERYRDELVKSLPEVDDFLLTSELLTVGAVAAQGGEARLLDDMGRPYFLYDDTMPRKLASKQHMAYVKVAEGCNRPCTFCIIPRIRGEMRSRPVQSIVDEVAALGADGVREVNLVAQDLTSYGTDREGERLVDLLQALNARNSVQWIRLLYSYPIGIDETLLRAMVELPTVCNYLDLPLQHASESVLKRMKRPVGRYATKEIVRFIREKAPELTLRTTFIVGFPGETEADVDELVTLVSEGHFGSVGVFTYSSERGTPAAEMDGQVPKRVKEARRNRVMAAQQRVLEERLAGYIGTTLPVLVEGTHDDTDLLLVGRTSFQAPEVDGVVLINDVAGIEGMGEVTPGNIYLVEITEVAGYDLVGRIVSPC